MAKRLKIDDRHALIDWDEFVQNIARQTSVDTSLSHSEREARRKQLERDPILWMLEMFPNYAKYPFASFHKKAIKRIIEHDDWYEVLSWSRELSKSTIVMMIILYLVLTGKKKNIILVSDSKDNAVRLLNPYRANLEANQRIKFYYGDQQGIPWKENEFITRGGAAFRGLGAGQSPRGSRNEQIRPDTLLMDDFDTDEDCRNPDIINNKWNWFEQALYFTRSISEPLLTIWCGNIIAKDCCITRAGTKAVELAKRAKPLGNWDVINLRMVNINKPDPKNDFLSGKSVWPQKNTEEKIDTVQAQVSSLSVQKECYNNPVSIGEIFKEMVWGRIPPLNRFKFLIAYGDPAPSNSTNGKGSYKSLFLIGRCEGKSYVVTGFLDHVVNSEYVNWYYHLKDFVGDKTQIYNFIENNSLQNPFYEQVFIPLFVAAAKEKGTMIGITPDTRSKPDKFSRIEGNLEPLNRMGNLILNEAEKSNPHMVKLEDQFKMVNPKLSAPADGPDCIEGGVWIINEKTSQLDAGSYTVGVKKVNSKRF